MAIMQTRKSLTLRFSLYLLCVTQLTMAGFSHEILEQFEDRLQPYLPVSEYTMPQTHTVSMPFPSLKRNVIKKVCILTGVSSGLALLNCISRVIAVE